MSDEDQKPTDADQVEASMYGFAMCPDSDQVGDKPFPDLAEGVPSTVQVVEEYGMDTEAVKSALIKSGVVYSSAAMRVPPDEDVLTSKPIRHDMTSTGRFVSRPRVLNELNAPFKKRYISVTDYTELEKRIIDASPQLTVERRLCNMHS